ncbi:RdgB/HAM1 family non-canonical purine NTP pyrophosphatase [archaeon]|nr:RdgB/HAM1 family non-canonical purine NTP pyrophosphatase [archaeon]
MTLYFITGNSHKFAEAKQIISDVEQVKLDLDEIQSMDPKEIIEHKLRHAMKQHKGPLFCEDVSLCINALNGFPGPLVKFWNKSGSVENRVKRVHLSDDHRATVICTIGYFDGKETQFFLGSVEGKIVVPRENSDFGFDPIFEVASSGKTFAEMTVEEKNKVSHRAIALSKLKYFLDSKN